MAWRPLSAGRLAAATLFAGLLPGAVLGLIGALEAGLLQRPAEALAGIAAFALVFLYFVLPVVLCLGLPLFWVLRNLVRAKWWAYALAGALVATVWFGLFLAAPATVEGGEKAKGVVKKVDATSRFLTVVALPGALSGLGFWLGAHLPFGRKPRPAGQTRRRTEPRLAVPRALVEGLPESG